VNSLSFVQKETLFNTLRTYSIATVNAQDELLSKRMFFLFHRIVWQHFWGVVGNFINICQISSEFCVPKNYESGGFLTELFKNW